MILRAALAGLLTLGSVAFYLERLDAPGPQPEGLASDGVHLWVSDFQTGRLYGLDTATGEVARSHPAPGPRPEGLAWDGTHLWCGDWDLRMIYRLDVANDTAVVVSQFPAPGGDRPVGLAWDGSALWLTTWFGFSLYRIDPVDGSTLRERSLTEDPVYPSGGPRPEDLAWDGEFLWITDWFTQEIHRVEVESLTVVQTIPSAGPRSVGLAFHDGNLWNGDTGLPGNLTQPPGIFRLEVTDPSPVRRTSWGRLKAGAGRGPR